MGRGDKNRGEALSLRRKPTLRKRNREMARDRKKEGEKSRRLNEGLVCIHLALISQTGRVMVRKETEELLFLALLEIQCD